MTDRRAEIAERQKAAIDMVSALCTPRGSYGAREWIMSIPARPSYDPDIVIADALKDIPWLLSELTRLTAEAEAQRAEVERLTALNSSLERLNVVMADSKLLRREYLTLTADLERMRAAAGPVIERLQPSFSRRPATGKYTLVEVVHLRALAAAARTEKEG